MKRSIIYCCVGGCETVLGTMEWDTENPEFTLYECVGEQCQACKDEQSKPKPMQKFTAPRFGATQVTAPNDFDQMMAKRKIENRKASGKGPPRGGR